MFLKVTALTQLKKVHIPWASPHLGERHQIWLRVPSFSRLLFYLSSHLEVCTTHFLCSHATEYPSIPLSLSRSLSVFFSFSIFSFFRSLHLPAFLYFFLSFSHFLSTFLSCASESILFSLSIILYTFISMFLYVVYICNYFCNNLDKFCKFLNLYLPSFCYSILFSTSYSSLLPL